MLSVGQVLRERYRIDALPEAPFIAYRGYDTTENRICAIKEFEGDEAARLEREAEALASHRHPNLPLLYDYFTLDDRLYAVFEWPEGESLRTRLERQGRLEESDATQWVGQILSALDYIHALNLPIGRGGFSPAHIWVDDDRQATLYGAGLTEMTALPSEYLAPYLAPEGGSDRRSDVYSAGTTLYTLLTARPPENKSPRKTNQAVSVPTAQVIQRAMPPRPEARYVTIREMRKALGRAKHREHVEIALGAPPQTFPLVPLVSGIGVLLLLIAGFFFLRGSIAAIAFSPTASPTAAFTAAPTAAAIATTAPLPTATGTPSATPSPRPPPPTSTPNLTPQPGATAISPRDKMVLVYVPAGDFLMGSADTDPLAFGDEKPQHKVNLPAFWIDRTEVTNAQYQKCVADGACTPPAVLDSATRPGYYSDPAYADYPVIWVNWKQADAYCQWAGRRLPSEAEWEKAARGADGRLYPWGNQRPDNTLLNFNLAAGDTTKVGSFPNGASPYGALDMSGNIVEWVADYYSGSYFVLLSSTGTPTPSFHGGVHALRSSSWNDLFANIRAASRRYSNSDTAAYNNVGFRCVGDDKPT